MNADGTCPIQLLDTLGVNTPAWSPDGRYIAFEFEGGLYALDLQAESVSKRMEGLNCNR
jgi:Tol biopolymer transport system component